jgi:hypothetical protein
MTFNPGPGSLFREAKDLQMKLYFTYGLKETALMYCVVKKPGNSLGFV